MKIDKGSIAHTAWNCKYHIVFAPKYRRKVFYEEKRLEIGQILRQLCEWKGIGIIEAEVCPDHIHMLITIPPKYSVSSVMGMRYLSAYIGILNSNGNVDFNVDDISICQKWQEHLKRIEEESKISPHDGKQVKDNQKENNQQSKNGNDGR